MLFLFKNPFLQLFFCVLVALFCMMEAAPQRSLIPAAIAGGAIGKAIAIKGNSTSYS
jgi:hypothetical protein